VGNERERAGRGTKKERRRDDQTEGGKSKRREGVVRRCGTRRPAGQGWEERKRWWLCKGGEQARSFVGGGRVILFVVGANSTREQGET